MVSITNTAIVEKIKGTGRTFTLSIKVGTNTFTKVKSLRRSSIFASNQKLSVGEAVSAFIEAEINDCRESLQNYEVEPILSIDGYDIPLGIFKVQAPSQADGSGTQKITAYDRMSETNKFTYKATGLTSAISTFRAICTTCGYTADTSGLTDVAINDRLLDGLDCRKALGYVAGVFGKNCVVGTDGKFKMLGYSKIAESTCKISINSLDTLDFPSKVSTIDYFNAVVDEATIYKSGTGNSGLNVVNSLFKDTSQTYSILTYLKSNVGSNGYYPAKFKQLNGDPRIEVGDVIKVEHRDTLTGEVTSDYVPVMSLVLDYDGGVTVSIEAYPTESEFSMSLSDKMDLTNSSNNNKFEDLAGDIDDVNGRVDGFEEDIEGANQKADFAVIQSAAVEELNKVIGNSLGLYQTKITGVGGDTKYYFHNKETLDESTYIVSMTDQGFAFATAWNNGNPVWKYGITKDGNAIFNYLVAEKISANLIEAGVIKSLDNAPVKTEFSLNTGLMSMIANAKKESFAFGVNKSNHLLLQYNYSDGDKNSVKLGHYYSGQFYKDVQHTELITPSSNYYYGDITSGDFYEYSSGRYSKLMDLSGVYETYKGFIMHSSGTTVGYGYSDLLGVLYSDLTANMADVLGGNFGIVDDIESTPDSRTPILKFYDFENESPDGSDHYTAIRKQSIVTKYFGAEKIAFYYGGKATDLEMFLAKIFGAVLEQQTLIEVLSDEIRNLKSILGAKTLLVSVTANPLSGGTVSGTGSYTLEDGNFEVVANTSGEYKISSVTLFYSSDGSTTTYSKSQLLSNDWLDEIETHLQMTLPVESSRLGDTLNVTVNFSEPTKYTLTVNADPAGAGKITSEGKAISVGSYLPNTRVKLTATANSGYKFKGWYENGSLVYSSANVEIIMSSDRTLTAKFESSGVLTAEIVSNGNSTDTVYLSSTVNGGNSLGTKNTFTENSKFYFYAKAGTNRVIEKIVISSLKSGTEEYSASQFVGTYISNDYTTFNLDYMAYENLIGDTIQVTVYFVDANTGGGEEPTYYYNITLIADPTSGGTVSGGGQVKAGETTTISAISASGYSFDGWYENGILTDLRATANIVANRDRMLTAKFVASGGGSDTTYYTVTTAVSPSGAGTVTGGGRFAEGTKVYLTATPASGYVLSDWRIELPGYSENLGMTDNPLEINVVSDSTLTAIFTPTSGGGDVPSDKMRVKVTASGLTSDDYIQIYDSNGYYDGVALGTDIELSYGETCIVHADTPYGRKITQMEFIVDGVSLAFFSSSDLYDAGMMSANHRVLDHPVRFYSMDDVGKTKELKIYFGTA